MRRPLKKLKNRWFPEFGTLAYSQEGEDLILNRFFSGVDHGFYVDVGAHHPQRFSNTYLFYLRGWNGINIDAMPGSMAPFRRLRPRDCNLEVAISREAGEKIFYVFNDPALNTFDEALLESRIRAGYRIQRKIQVPIAPLAAILEKHCPPGQRIDFMSVDVEGLDLAVLQSNDWRRFRPRMLLVECLNSSLSRMDQDPIHQFLQKQGYELCAKTMNTFFFRDPSSAG